MQFLISLAIPVKNIRSAKYGTRYNGAVLQTIDWETKSVVNQVEYPAECSIRWPNVSHQFKGSHLTASECWAVTNNEIVIYDRFNWCEKRRFSHPLFNDLHSVLPLSDGFLVCNTGLEVVQRFDDKGSLLETINVATTPTSERFDLAKDYRNVPSTKPREVHPNYLFRRGDEIWVTRCLLRDSAMLYDQRNSSARLPAICHDGLVVGNLTYFTTVTGHICAVSNSTNMIELDIDLNRSTDLRSTVGWTRGLCVNGSRAYIGTSAMRESKALVFAKWVKKRIGGTTLMPSSIVEVDLETERIVDVYTLSDFPGAAIYSILRI